MYFTSLRYFLLGHNCSCLIKNRVNGFPYFVLSKEDKNEKLERFLKIDEYI